MYAKLFASLYQGTLRGRSDEILVFTNLLAHASRDGTVDKHFRAIAEETGLTIEEVKAAILVLESPDEESRSPEEDGARLVKMDGHRAWGWLIVNYAKYRAIRSEEDRAEQNRLAQQRWRNKSKPPSAESKQDKPKEREEGKVEGKGEAKEKAGAAVAAEWVGLPDGLRTEEFKTAWTDYITYRRERKFSKLGDRSVAEQWREMQRLGCSNAVASIRETIRQGWQGLFPPKNGAAVPRAVAPQHNSTDNEL